MQLQMYTKSELTALEKSSRSGMLPTKRCYLFECCLPNKLCVQTLDLIKRSMSISAYIKPLSMRTSLRILKYLVDCQEYR
jgi:hypothetical protein